MSSVEQLTTIDRLPEPNPSGGSDSFSSCGGPNWDLLGDLMIDLGGGGCNNAGDQGPLKMQNSSLSENLAPAPAAKLDSDKGLTLKMKIKRKSKNEEKHEIVTPEMEKFRLLSAVSSASVKLEEADSSAAPAAKKSRPDKSNRHAPGAKRDAWANTATVGTGVEPDCLGPCDSGTSISLDGLVWLETDTGVLVVNVTWRGRTYVGTLLDSSRHDFAPPLLASSTDSSTAGAVEDSDASNSSNGGSRWCQQQLQAQQLAMLTNGSHHQLAYQHSQHHGGRGGRGNRRRGGRPIARQLPLANGSSGSSGGGVGAAGGSELPHIRCPEPGCDKRFAQLQALKWHSINQHSVPASCSNSHLQQPQSQANLREEKSLDGSSVFKVPHTSKSTSSTTPAVVTVTKTCPVPAGPASAAASFKAIQPKSSGSRASSSSAGRRSADPVSPAYSDISDEGGAPVLEREDEQSNHRDRHQVLARSLSAIEATRAKSLPPQQQQQQVLSAKSLPPQQQQVLSAKSLPPQQQQQVLSAKSQPSATSSTSAAVSVPTPSAAAPPRTPSSAAAPAKPSLGHSPSEGEGDKSSRAPHAAHSHPALMKPIQAPASAPVPSSTAASSRAMLQQQQQQQPSPRRPSQSPSSASSPRFHQHQLQHPSSAAAAAAAAMAAGFDQYRLFSSSAQPSPYQLPGLDALSQYAAAMSSTGRQQQHQQQQQLHHHQHKIHELSRNASPKASPPLVGGQNQLHHQLHQAAALHHHQQQQQQVHHRVGQSQPPPPALLPHHQQQHHHLMEQFQLPFSLASQMMHGAPSPHYLQPK